MAVMKLFHIIHIYLFVTMISYVIQCTCIQDFTATGSKISDKSDYKTRIFKTGRTEKGLMINSLCHTFESLVCESCVFMDNTLLIWYVYTQSRLVVTLPRAFGKTINLNMIKYFYGMEVAENTLKPIPKNETKAYQTFEMGVIDCDGDPNKLQDKFLVYSVRNLEFYEYIGYFPVVYLNIGQTGTLNSLNDVCVLIRHRIKRTINEHAYIMEVSSTEVDSEIRIYQDDFNRLQVILDADTGNGKKVVTVIPKLIRLLKKIFKRNVFVLIDEYDAVLNEIYFGDSVCDASERTKIIEFFANLYGSIAKQEEYVARVFMTGILCWRGSDTFSSIVRMRFHTVSEGDSINFYGMNDEIVKELLTTAGLGHTYATVVDYYKGYNFGESSDFIVKYNPYAVASFVSEKGITSKMNFWTECGSASSMLKNLLRYQNFLEKFLILLQENAIKITDIYDITTFTKQELDYFSDAIHAARDAPESEWYSLISPKNADQLGFKILLATGYLTKSASPPYDFEETRFPHSQHWVRVTNKEVLTDFITDFIPIMRGENSKCSIAESAYWRSALKTCGDKLGNALMQNDLPNFQEFAFAYENVIKSYIPTTWQIRSDHTKKGYANEALFESLLTTVINYNLFNMSLKRLETQHQFSYLDKRRADVVIQYKDDLTIFEMKYCPGEQLNVTLIKDTLQNATTQALGYADWYSRGNRTGLYRAFHVNVVALVVTQYENRVVMRIVRLNRYDIYKKNMKTKDHWPDSFRIYSEWNDSGVD